MTILMIMMLMTIMANIMMMMMMMTSPDLLFHYPLSEQKSKKNTFAASCNSSFLRLSSSS